MKQASGREALWIPLVGQWGSHEIIGRALWDYGRTRATAAQLDVLTGRYAVIPCIKLPHLAITRPWSP